jgi:Toprim domain-containing protein
VILKEILEQAGVEVHKRENNEVNICCPFCGEQRFRLGINLANGSAHCFNGSCEFKARGVMYTARQLCRVYGVKFNGLLRDYRKEVQPKKKVVADVQPVGLPEEYEAFTPDMDEVGQEAKRYLKSRGVSLLQIVKHKIGYAITGDMAWRVLFPVEGEDSRVYGCVGRAIRDDMRPKYLNTSGMKMLWNAQRRYHTAVVVEGIMDALRVETALLRSGDAVAVARLGSVITPVQMDQLKLFEEVVVLPDWDRVGVTGAIELCSRCDSRGIKVSVCIPACMSGIDPGSMSDDNIFECLTGAVKWGKGTEWRLRESALRDGD